MLFHFFLYIILFFIYKKNPKCMPSCLCVVYLSPDPYKYLVVLGKFVKEEQEMPVSLYIILLVIESE